MTKEIIKTEEQFPKEIEVPFLKEEDAKLFERAVRDHNFIANMRPWGVELTDRHQPCEINIRQEDIRTGGIVIPNFSAIIRVTDLGCKDTIMLRFWINKDAELRNNQGELF